MFSRDVLAIYNSDIGQPLAYIYLQGTSTDRPILWHTHPIWPPAFGRDGSLAIWSFMCVAQIMMTASLLLPASRQAFAFARDGALPFSKYFYSVNKKTQTPVRSEFPRQSGRLTRMLTCRLVLFQPFGS